jgi:hypothetical protein
MCTRKAFIIAVLVFWMTGTGLSSAQEIDRLLAAVNGRVITEGDFQMALSLNAVLTLGKGVARPSRQEVLDRLINLELTRQELENFPVEQGDRSKIQASVQATMSDLKSAYAEIGGLPAILRQLGLQEDELLSYVRLQVLADRFIDLRFGPFVSISAAEVEAYYRETLAPPLERSGSALPPLDEVAPKIKEILTKDKATAAYVEWVDNIRSHSRIEIFANTAPPSEKKQP